MLLVGREIIREIEMLSGIECSSKGCYIEGRVRLISFFLSTYISDCVCKGWIRCALVHPTVGESVRTLVKVSTG